MLQLDVDKEYTPLAVSLGLSMAVSGTLVILSEEDDEDFMKRRDELLSMLQAETFSSEMGRSAVALTVESLRRHKP